MTSHLSGAPTQPMIPGTIRVINETGRRIVKGDVLELRRLRAFSPTLVDWPTLTFAAGPDVDTFAVALEEGEPGAEVLCMKIPMPTP